ncbi:MAG TPA: hypothetical protein ENN03_01965 [bacterium]|nr:hypothetical protein [bacterium]
MNFLFLILIIGLIIFGLKTLFLALRAGVIIMTIPLALIAACLMTGLCVLIFPFTLLTGFMAFVAASLGFLLPLVPFILIGWGFYLLTRRRPE